MEILQEQTEVVKAGRVHWMSKVSKGGRLERGNEVRGSWMIRTSEMVGVGGYTE